MADSRVHRRLAAILAADMVGYSKLMEGDEEGTFAALIAYRHELIEPCIQANGGRLIKTTGDGLLVEFASVVDAVRCAVSLQRSMADRNRDLQVDRRIAFRIGISLGDVIVQDGDVFGTGVNVASRLEGLAEPGGICLSEDAYRQIKDRLDLPVSDAGLRRLKNIAGPVRVYAVDGLGGDSGQPAERGVRRPRFWRPAAALLALVPLPLAAWLVWQEVRPPTGERPAGPHDVRPPLTPSAAMPVIAVMPFANQTGDESQDYFADGVTDDLINALGRFNSLRVLGRSAVQPFRDRPASSAAISAELGAAYLVEGSVRRTDRQLRITAQMTDSASGTVLWSERYEGETGDLFRLQDEITGRIAGTLEVNVVRAEGLRLGRRLQPGLGAYELVLQARAIGYSGTRSANRRFRQLLTEALERDPNYATAHALLAEALDIQAIQGWTQFPDEVLSEAERHARRALALAPDEPDGHRALGRLLAVRGNYAEAKHELRRAIEINPSDAHALAVWGDVLSFTGDIDGAVEALRLALQLNPRLDAVYVFDLSLCLYFLGRHEEALRTAEGGLNRFPEFAMFNVAAAAAAAELGRDAEARRYVSEIRARLPFLNLERLGSRYENPALPAYLRAGLQRAGL